MGNLNRHLFWVDEIVQYVSRPFYSSKWSKGHLIYHNRDASRWATAVFLVVQIPRDVSPCCKTPVRGNTCSRPRHQQRGIHLVQRQPEKAQHGVHHSKQVFIYITTGMNAIFHFQPPSFLFNITHLKWRVHITGDLAMLCQPRPTLSPVLGTLPGRRKNTNSFLERCFSLPWVPDHLLRSFSTESWGVLGGYHHISSMEADDRHKP